MSSSLTSRGGSDPFPLFISARPRIGAHATVEVSSAIQASGTLTSLGPDARATVDIGGCEVSGTLVPSLRRITLDVTPAKAEMEVQDEDLSPC